MIDDIRIPENWSKGSNGGFEFSTTVIPTLGGESEKDGLWDMPLRRYEIAHNIKSPEDMAALRTFHLGRRGRLRGFLIKDWLDYSSASDNISAVAATNQPLGTGTGAQTQFQLVKRYADSVNPIDIDILWPVTGTLVIAQDGTPMGSGFSVARGTGIVTFSVAPANGVVLTSGYQFDVPVSFEDDLLRISWDTINSRSLGSVQLVEERPS